MSILWCSCFWRLRAFTGSLIAHPLRGLKPFKWGGGAQKIQPELRITAFPM